MPSIEFQEEFDREVIKHFNDDAELVYNVCISSIQTRTCDRDVSKEDTCVVMVTMMTG